MTLSPYQPIFELTRGQTIECIHDGAIAVVDAQGKLQAWFGDPHGVTFLRSSAKPFQAMPFITHGGHAYYHLTPKEIALICASHSGTDEHAATACAIQAKAGVSESELLCGMHEPMDAPTAARMRETKEPLTSNRHNCSGKHSGMLAYLHMKRALGAPLPAGLDYIDFEHPIQKEIVQTFAEMCGLPPEQVGMGIDGCSAPNFAVPLYNAALGFARLSDPEAGCVEPEARRSACHTIVQAMMGHPDMVGGPGRFDTRLMQTAAGKIVCKGGAEAFQGIGLLPGALGPGSPALGIAIKIGDGDARQMALHAVALETLRQLGALTAEQMAALGDFGPQTLRYNWRKIEVGRAYPTFELRRN